MKQHYILLFLSFILFSCSSDSTENSGEKEAGTYSYSFFANKKLVLSTYDSSYIQYGLVETGTNLVFEYRYDAVDKPEIADDEYGETIKFEINPTLSSFSYSGTELSQINLVFTKYCYCFFPKTSLKEKVPTGTLTGKKLSTTNWEITADLTFYGDEKKTFKQQFILKQ
ncbi:hypothetical protein [Flavobacterium muglaense]|uniref:Lipoprotein n=1 Tax=Flavobacterium muglaense TaxID=2764716 RepID=A0A923N077_9FLAO|nr:hypothetical protein [Flavobacterium muglaense]MBC5837911.1 hypothetical protein [Flavobacterium muglaense]MBC5844380.1 hypothetical protein [Flavobacterium muglaense]